MGKKPKITDLSVEEPSDVPAVARTTPRQTFLLELAGAVAPDGTAQGKARLKKNAPEPDTRTTSAIRRQAAAMGLAIAPAAGTACLCFLAHAWVWVTVLLPILVWAGAYTTLRRALKDRDSA